MNIMFLFGSKLVKCRVSKTCQKRNYKNVGLRNTTLKFKMLLIISLLSQRF